jgi:hypothetical protein
LRKLSSDEERPNKDDGIVSVRGILSLKNNSRFTVIALVSIQHQFKAVSWPLDVLRENVDSAETTM